MDGVFFQLTRVFFPLFLPNLPNKFDDKIRSRFDEWVYVLKHSSVKSEFTAAGTQEAAEKLDILKMTDQEREEYERERRYNHDVKMQKYTAEMKVSKAKKEGIEIGRAEEREIADKEIAQKDNTIAQLLSEKTTIVLNAHKMGMSIDDIAKITALSHQQITEIINPK